MSAIRGICLVCWLGLLGPGPGWSFSSMAADEQAVDVTRYSDLTLDQWRDRIKSLDPTSPDAADAVTGLLEIVEDSAVPWFTRRQAALTLGRIGKPAAVAVPVLEKLACGPVPDDAAPALWAMKALALFGPAAASATPTIARVALDPTTESHLQLLSIEALCRIGLAHPQTLPTVITLLRRDEPVVDPGRVRSGTELDRVVAAIQCLELFRAGGADAVPILLRYSEDREERVRRAVAVTLGAFGPRGIEAAARLAEMVVTDPSHDVRDVAAASLGQIGGTEWLVRLLRISDPATRERACLGLGHSSPSDQSARMALTRAGTDPAAVVRIASIEAFQQVTKDAQISAPAAARELESPERSVRLRAIRLLTQLGPKATPARHELQKLSNHSDPQVAKSAQRLLEQLPPEAVHY